MKILIEALHGLGDMVCTLPMIQLVRNTYPEAFIMVLTKFDAASDILRASNIDVNEIQAFDIYKSVSSSVHMITRLRNMHFDYGINNAVTPVRKANFFMKAVRPKQAIGLQPQAKVFFDDMHDQYHFVEANLQAVKEICPLPSRPLYPRLYANQENVKQIRNTLGKDGATGEIVGICIGDADYSLKNRFLRTGKVYTRSWGITHMADLIGRLRKKGITIVLIGGKAEKHLIPYLEQRGLLSGRVYDFVGKTTILESIALASVCKVVFGVDTGMQHIASAVGAQTVSVFGPTNPVTHGAYGPKTHFLVNRGVCPYQFCYGTKRYVNCPNKRVCLSSIAVETAFNEIIHCLAE